MKCSVFIATSVDGFIASKNGSVEWLDTAGKHDVDMGDQADMGWNRFFPSIDCMIMGRNTMEVLSGFELSPEQWPYGDTRIIILSTTVKNAPDNLNDRVEIFSGDIPSLVDQLENEGYQHAYIDGGQVIQSFLNLELIDEMTITQAPILLGEGIPLFGSLSKNLRLEDAEATAYPNDFIQLRYKVSYQ